MARRASDLATQPGGCGLSEFDDDATDEVPAPQGGGPTAESSHDWAETPLEVNAWVCSICGVQNALDTTVCRVCRASTAPGAGDRADEDNPTPGLLRVVLPLTCAIVLSAIFFSGISPAATPWAQVTTVHGRLNEGGTSRVQALRLAVIDLRVLALELQGDLARGHAPPPAYSAKLGYVRSRWQLYGDTERYPALHTEEAGIAEAFQDLSSIAFLAQSSPADPLIAKSVADIIHRLQVIEDSLQHAP